MQLLGQIFSSRLRSTTSCLVSALACASAVAAVLLTPVAGHGKTAGNPPTRYEELYSAFMNLTPDPSKGMVMNNLTITREAAAFHFEEGTLFLCKPVDGFTCAAIFNGKGRYSFTPQLAVEEAREDRVQ